MVKKVTGGKPLPDDVLDQIEAKTDGVSPVASPYVDRLSQPGYLAPRVVDGRSATSDSSGLEVGFRVCCATTGIAPGSNQRTPFRGYEQCSGIAVA